VDAQAFLWTDVAPAFIADKVSIIPLPP